MFFLKTSSSTQIKQRISCLFQLLYRNINSTVVAYSDKYQNLWTEDFDSLFKMPKSKEYLSSDESSSQSSEDEKPKKKAKVDKEVKEKKSKVEKDESSSKKATSSNKSNEEEPTWELGNLKEIKVREWKGKLYVDIREMYVDKSGDMKPGRKGISLNAGQFRKLMDCIEEVNEAFKAKS